MSKRSAPTKAVILPPPVIDLGIIEAGLQVLGYSEMEALPEYRVFLHRMSEGQSCVLLRAPAEVLWNEHPRLAGAHPVSDKIMRLLLDKGTAARAQATAAVPAPDRTALAAD